LDQAWKPVRRGPTSRSTRHFFPSPLPIPALVRGFRPRAGWSCGRQPALQANDVPRAIALLCSPKYVAPFGTLLADDVIYQRWIGGTGAAPSHMLQGGKDSLPWNQSLSTKDYPAFRGPGGNALTWKDVTADSDALQTVQDAGIAVLGGDFLLGGGIACLGALLGTPGAAVPCTLAVGVAVVAGLMIAAPAIVNLIGRYLQRNDAMNNGNWFAWSNGAGIFNGFGDVDQTWINPSLFSANDNAEMRVGVVFSNVLLNQGPDYDLGRRGPVAASQSRRLGTLAQRLARPQGRTRAGTRRDERLFGGRRQDHLFGALAGTTPCSAAAATTSFSRAPTGTSGSTVGPATTTSTATAGPTPPRAVPATTRSSTCSAAPPSTPGAEKTSWSSATGTAATPSSAAAPAASASWPTLAIALWARSPAARTPSARAPAPPARG
jgi:hypothetical protein